MKKRGQLITLEGVEGAGKSTQMATLCSVIENAGHKVILSREPGGTALAESIRSILLDGEGMPAITELLLMFAARSSHFSEKIQPALECGDWVLCDRFVDASYAYQGGGRGLPWEQIQALEAITLQGLSPDQVFLFDLPVEAGMARAKSRGDENRFEMEDLSFMQRVREAYLQRAKQAPSRYTIIDANADLDTVTLNAKKAIQDYLNHVGPA